MLAQGNSAWVPWASPLLLFNVVERTEGTANPSAEHRVNCLFPLVQGDPSLMECLCATSNLSGNYGFLKSILFLAGAAPLPCHCSTFNSTTGIVTMPLKSSREFTSSLPSGGSAFLMDLLSATCCFIRNALRVSFYCLRSEGVVARQRCVQRQMW